MTVFLLLPMVADKKNLTPVEKAVRNTLRIRMSSRLDYVNINYRSSQLELSRTPDAMEKSSEVCLLRPVDGLSMRLVSSADPSAFKSSAVFKILDNVLKEDTEGTIEKARGIYNFKVKNKEGKEAIWTVNASTGKGSVVFNGKDKPDVTFMIGDEDVIDLLSGKLNSQKAYFQGKIKITGNMGMAMKITNLLKKAGSKMENFKAKL